MKIRRSYISIALIVLVVQTGMAQEQKRDSLDTGKVYEIGEVVVTGTRNETLPAPVMKRMSDICRKPCRWSTAVK